MNLLEELRLHVGALAVAVKAEPKFFVSVRYVERLEQVVKRQTELPNLAELNLLATKIEEFWSQWRPSGDGLYIPPPETSNTDSMVRRISELVAKMHDLPPEAFGQLARKTGEQSSATIATAKHHAAMRLHRSRAQQALGTSSDFPREGARLNDGRLRIRVPRGRVDRSGAGVAARQGHFCCPRAHR